MTPKLPDDPAPASLSFIAPATSNLLTLHEFCNKHGLFVGPSWTAATTGVSTSTTSTTTTTKTTTTLVAVGAPSSGVLDALNATPLPGGTLANLAVGAVILACIGCCVAIAARWCW